MRTNIPAVDTDPRWRQFPDVTVTIQSCADFRSDDIIYDFLIKRKGGDFMVGTSYNSLYSARRGAERMIRRGVWQTPVAQPGPTPKRSQIFGPIGQPDGALADFLAQWTEENT